MKKIFTLIFGMLLMCHGLNAQTPSAYDLRNYEQKGYFVVCVCFEGEVCNDIVFAGSYNGWATSDPASMVKFEPLGGFDGWYVAVVPVTVYEDGVEVNDGKPVQLAQDGSFSWGYQTGDVDSWDLISGYVEISEGYGGESDLRNFDSSEPIILRSKYWKWQSNEACVEIVQQDYTIYLKAPSCGGYEPAIIGDFNNWNEGVPMDLQWDGYYKAVITSSVGKGIKFKASTDTDWSNEILYSDWGGMFKEWRTLSNYELGIETTIYLDYSTPGYSWTLCDAIDYSSTSKYHNFEDANTSYQWYSLNNYGVNFWTIGTAAGSVDGGSSALYISSNYYEYSYDNSRSSDSWVYLPVTLSQSDEISFSWKGVADSDYDNLQVYLSPKGNVPSWSGVPNAAIALGEPLAGASDWQKFRAQPGVEGEYYLCFRWINDNNMMGSMPIAIDNVQIGAGAPAQTYDYTIRVKKSDTSDMDISNGVWLWWWNTNANGQWASTTLDNDDWYTATVRSTESTINCLAANDSEWYYVTDQTEDFVNITGDVCLQIGDRNSYSQYTLNELSCSNEEPLPCYTVSVNYSDGGYASAYPARDCYYVGTPVEISAYAYEGYKFSHWSTGDTSPYITISVYGDVEITAYFTEVVEEPACYTLSVSASGEGVVNVEPEKECYEEGEMVILEAVANEGYVFSRWSDNNTSAIRTLTMDRNYQLQAVFEEKETEFDVKNLTVTNSKLNITAKWESIATRFEVTITDQNDSVVNAEVVEISDEKKVYKYKVSKYAQYTVTVKPLDADDNKIGRAQSQTITLERKYSLYISSGIGGTVNEEVNGDYLFETSVEIIATPKEGYEFFKWSDGNTSAIRTLIMDQDYELVAYFNQKDVAVEDVCADVTVAVEYRTIIVESTQSQDFALYDVVGRLIERQAHTDIANFTVPSAGLYLLRTNNGFVKVKVE